MGGKTRLASKSADIRQSGACVHTACTRGHSSGCTWPSSTRPCMRMRPDPSPARASSRRQPVHTSNRKHSPRGPAPARPTQACASAGAIPVHEFRRVASINPSRAREQIAPRRRRMGAPVPHEARSGDVTTGAHPSSGYRDGHHHISHCWAVRQHQSTAIGIPLPIQPPIERTSPPSDGLCQAQGHLLPRNAQFPDAARYKRGI